MIHSHMKPSRESAPFPDESNCRGMPGLVCCSLAFGLWLVAGCSEEQPATPAANPAPASVSLNLSTPAQAAPAPAVPAAGAPANPQSQPSIRPGQLAEDGTDLGLNKINDAVQEFHENQERLPSTLAELVSKGYLRQLPQPPPGKRYHLDTTSGHVQLVNQ